MSTSQTTRSEGGISWPRAILVVAAVVLLGVFVWWSWTGGGGSGAQAVVVCAQCGQQGTARVGDTPGDEEWPRNCPACNQKALYLGVPCPNCGKFIPLKDDHARRTGYPSECPHCHTRNTRGT